MLYAVRMAIVRTPEGSQRFDRPIGSPLSDPGPGAPSLARPVSPIRLRSLRAMILDKMNIGDKQAVRQLTEKFRAELAQFSVGKSQTEIDQALTKAE